MGDDNLCIAFKNGLNKIGLSMDDLKKYVYCGAQQPKYDSDAGPYQDRHNKRYYATIGLKNTGTIKKSPTVKHVCVCGQKLKRDYYISNLTEYSMEENDNVLLDTFIKMNVILIIGSCCIKKFIEGGIKQRCEFCDEVTSNRATQDVNWLLLCGNCRPLKGKSVKCHMCNYYTHDRLDKDKHFVCSLCYKGYIKCCNDGCRHRSYFFKMRDGKYMCNDHM